MADIQKRRVPGMDGIGRQESDDQNRDQIQRHDPVGRLGPAHQADEGDRGTDDQQNQGQPAGGLKGCFGRR